VGLKAEDSALDSVFCFISVVSLSWHLSEWLKQTIGLNEDRNALFLQAEVPNICKLKLKGNCKSCLYSDTFQTSRNRSLVKKKIWLSKMMGFFNHSLFAFHVIISVGSSVCD
jgi:hypothetical protein